MKDFGEEIVDNDEILNIVNEIKILMKEDKYRNDSIKDFTKDYLDKIEKLEEALLNYMGGNDLKILKTEFPDRWKYLNEKLAYPYEYFNSLDEYNKPVHYLKRENFFSKFKNDFPSDKEIEGTKQITIKFNIKNGEELTQLYLKSDVFLLACVFAKFIKISVLEYGINPLCCVSLPGNVV